MIRVTIMQGDNRLILKTFPDSYFSSCVCDPPYELGFMGKSWDKTGIAYDVAMWKEVYRVLKPGAHLLSFGGSRTYHRLACAIEDAGFEVRDSIMWHYGSGFPKSLNVSKILHEQNKTCSCRKTSVYCQHEEKIMSDMRTGMDPERPLSSCPESNMQSGVYGDIDRSEKFQTQGCPVNSVCCVREISPSSTAEPKEKQQNLLQRDLSEQNLCGPAQETFGEYEGQTSPREIQARESCLERRGHAIQKEGELQKHTLHKSTGAISPNGQERWLCNGTSPDNVKMVRLSSSENRSGSPYKSRPHKKRASKPGTLAEQSEPQTLGAWPICERCGLPMVLEGLGTALKPATEIICVARKPLEKGLTIVQNVLKHGTGAINVAGCRIEFEDTPNPATNPMYRKTAGYQNKNAPDNGSSSFHVKKTGEGERPADPAGRWPSNVILTYPEDEYVIRSNLSVKQKTELYQWLQENIL